MNRKILLVLIIVFSLIGISFTIFLHPRLQFDTLTISEEEWNQIVQGREEGDLSLVYLKFNDYNLIIDEQNSKVYYSLIGTSSNKFSPFVSYKASSYGTQISILNDEITDDKIMNNHEFKVLVYNDTNYKTYGLYCTTFPMINVVYDDSLNEQEHNIPMSIHLFNNNANGINRVVKSDGILNKVAMEDGTYNYRFSLVMTTTGNNERENVISLLQMQPSNEYFLNLINVGQNNSPIRNNMRTPRAMNKIPFRISGDNMPDSNRKNEKNVELFINNEYIGLYSLGYDIDVRLRPKNK